MDAPTDHELEETEEIHVEPTDDGHVWLQCQDWELLLTPEDARLLGQALIDTAADAEQGSE
jgi:hypothetical protein